MGFDFLSQAAKFLQEQKNYKRWLAVFLCLAVTTVFGTAAALKMYGQAMTHQVRVLDCQYEVHEHTDDCYEKDENGDPTGDPVCGYADYVIHVHNDDCYDENGNLVCPLEEIELHEHDEDCYEETEVLVCEEGESESVSGHQHTDACYTEVQGELICEESTEGGHTHDDSCYSRKLTCEKEEHTHDDGCYSRELTCSDESEEHEHGDGCYSEELTCDREEHTHDDGCYSEELTCEQEESAPHEHTDACYGTKKELTCTLGESESIDGHTHDDSCYETEEVLTCEELELHTHVEATVEDGGCYDESAFDEETGEFIEGSRPVCGIPQLEEHVHTEECFKTVELTPEEIAALENGAKLHVHTEACYDEEGNLICTLLEKETEVHEHDMHCYDSEGRLVCGNEDAKDHEHDAKCYDEEDNLTCGYEGVKDHEHDADCYDEEGSLICGYETVKEHEHDAKCYDEEGNLTCGYEDAKDHEHDAKCYDEDGSLICGYEGVKDHEHDADCYDIRGELICGYEGVEDHVHSEACYDEDGNLICGYEVLAVYDNSKIFECENYIVVARYNEDALIPEEAELLAEQITPETDEEHYAQREAEYQETLEDETASMRALLKIGFYLDGEEESENAEAESSAPIEIEPATPVEISIQFLDEDGLAEGSPITIVHFAEEGTEKLDGSKAKNSSTTFEMRSFSEIAIGYGPEKRITDDGKIALSDSFEYEDDAFHITFFIEGEAVPVEGSALPDSQEMDTNTEDEQTVSDEVNADSNGNGENAADQKGTTGDVVQVEASDTEKQEESEESTGEIGTEIQKLEFKVEPLDVDSERYNTTLASYADDIDEMDELLRMQLLSYSLTFEGAELDLSGCDVTAEITPTNNLQDYMEESLPEAVSYLANNEAVVNVSEGSVLKNADTGLESSDNETAEAEETAGNSEITEEDNETDAEGSIGAEENATSAENNEAGEVEAAIENDDVGVTEEEVVSDGSEILVYGDIETNIEDDIEIEDNTEILVTVAELSEADEVNEVENMVLSEETKQETMRFSLRRNVFALRSTALGDANPKFKVEYYANLKKVVRSGGTGTELKVINTSNGSTSTTNKGEGKGALPQNGKGLTTSPNGKTLQSIFLNSNGVVQTNSTPTKVYATKTYEYKKAPSLMYFDCLVENAGYKVVGVWVKYATDPSINGEGFKPSGITPDENGWYKYTYNAANPSLHFTNRRLTAAQEKNYVYINAGATIRLVYDPVDKPNNPFNAKFYDYNIASGKTGDVWNTEQKGINVASNYKGSGAKYAFGNANCGSGLEKEKWGSNFINQYNRTKKGGNDSYQGCVFGLVNGIEGNDKDGYNVKFSSGVNGLKIFGSNSLTGKDIYPGGNLNFSRSGDTYTLTSANSTVGSVNNLDVFTKLTEKDNGSSNPFVIWSNNFWPMENANASDPKTGQKGSPVKRTGGDFPVSDNGIAHNNFFGMHYTVKFNLDKDYVGPLEYLFFGDDDMWVFLDGKLICDLGGVHSSVGEYVNLWDWLSAADKGKEHTLHFFYTERGASGSSCWMQFTLPSVTTIPLEQNTGTLQVAKSVLDSDLKEVIDTNDEFAFRIKFTNNSNAELRDDYCYTKYDANGAEIGTDIILFSGSDFTLKNGEYINIKYLPIGTKYTIAELDDYVCNICGYAIHVDPTDPNDLKRTQEMCSNCKDPMSKFSRVKEYYQAEHMIEKMVDKATTTIQPLTAGSKVTGEIGAKGVEYKVKYNNLTKIYALPETGGPGSNTYTIAGVLVIMLGAGFLYKKKFRERRV